MLARAADNLFWLARYIERAENLARLLEASLRSAMLPSAGVKSGSRLADWETPLLMSGARSDFLERYENVTEGRVLSFMILDKQNPSSIRSSFGRARESARATRHLLTNDLWESVNQTWLTIAPQTWRELKRQGVEPHLEWVRERSNLFRGTLHGSMRRADGYFFTCLGGCLERADNTARLLRVKWASLNAVDHGVNAFYRAAVLLHALSAHKAYREIYSAHISVHKIAELMILRTDMPRSLAANIKEALFWMRELDADPQLIQKTTALQYRVESVRISDVMRTGLEGFLDDFIDSVAEIAALVQTSFMLAS